MRSFAAYAMVLAMTVLPVLALMLVVRVTSPWWTPRTRRVLLGLLVAGALGVTLWSLGAIIHVRWLATAGASMAAVVSVVAVPLCVAVPLSALIRAAVRRRTEAPPAAPLSPARRAFLQGAIGAAPALSLASSGVGVLSALPGPRVNAFDLVLPNLPPELDGLRVLQITDVHIGTFTGLDHLESGLARVPSPDLVLLTGDIADDLLRLPDALRMIAALRPRLGAFAVPGNHEYHRGIAEVLRLHDASDVRLLRSEGLLVHPKLWIAGADDPSNRALGPDERLARSVGAALAGRPDGAASIVLSHRPYGFVPASALAADLTLAGHTHGLQMALGGRSVGEALFPDHYLLGVYERGDSRLYTSAGAGHWFPFRIACPAELPLITLRSVPVARTV